MSGTVADVGSHLPIGQAAVAVVDAVTGDTLARTTSDAGGRYAIAFVRAATSSEEPPVAAGGPGRVAVFPNPLVGSDLTVRYTAPSGAAGAPVAEVTDVVGWSVTAGGRVAAGVYFVRLRFPDGRRSDAARVTVPSSRPLTLHLERLGSTPSPGVFVAAYAPGRRPPTAAARTEKGSEFSRAAFPAMQEVGIMGGGRARADRPGGTVTFTNGSYAPFEVRQTSGEPLRLGARRRGSRSC